ncbi:MAG TPA: FtsX-like permease family protein [Verrucomicrobia bacterium]|nr:FtsX-like permease family protein [Verrucomicrobiota bacterium]HPU56321.1 ABC transporter permease [Verrucomicrobiota bacterium]
MRRVLAAFKIALRALFRNKTRAFLTMLGIICGVAAVITTVSLGQGAKAQIEAQIASLGQNVIQVGSGSVTRGGIHTGWGSAGTLTIEDAEAIQREIPGVVGVSPEVRTSGQVAAGNANWFTQVLGESADYFSIRQWPVALGEPFTEQDVRSVNKVAVIGATVADQLYPGEDPIGKVIRIRNAPFIVVGVLASKGFNMFGQDQDDVVVIPYTSAMKRLLGQTSLRSIIVQAAGPEIIALTQQQITELLRQRHRITPDRDDDFTVRTQQEIAERATEASETMRNLLAGVAAVSLIVGGIGIMNIMLVSVTERTREIGIRMAVGARGRDVMLQFLIEAVTLSAIGGALGILAGVGASKWLTYSQGWPTATPLGWILISVCCSAVVGILFGFYPARKASQLDPIEALRYE